MLNSYQPIIHNSWLAPLIHTHLSHSFSSILKTKQALFIQSQESNHNSHCLAQHLAQAEGSRSGEPLRLGEGSKKENSSSREISPRWDLSRLGEMLARSRATWVAWATARVKHLGRASIDLAYARQTRLGWENQSSPLLSRAFTLNRSQMAWNHHTSVHITYQTYPNGKDRGTNNITQKKRANPSFPYLKNKLAECSDTHTVNTMVLRMAKELKWTAEQK